MYRNRGFTLLEVLIALFIFTIVALVLTKSLHMILSVQSSTEKSAARLTQLQMTLVLLTHDLEQTINRPISNTEGVTEVAFIGTKNTITFTHSGNASDDSLTPSSSLQRVRYTLERNQFIRNTWAVLDQIPPSTPTRRVLLTSIQQLYFRYLDSKNIFHFSWPADGVDEKLPRAVEITITLSPGGTLQQTYMLPEQEVPHALP